MGENEKTSVQITKEGLTKLNRLAKMYRRSATQQIEWMVDQQLSGLDAMKATDVTTLPHPPDAEPVPVITVQPE